MRVFLAIIMLFFITACDKLPFAKKQNRTTLDTIVDFTSVDLSPSFTECDSIVSKNKKSDCFRKTIHLKIGEELLKHKLVSKDSINEIVIVDLVINSKGNVVFKKLTSNEIIKQRLPSLDSLLEISINNLPTIHPAIKRGIPVTTKYQLPIQIVLE